MKAKREKEKRESFIAQVLRSLGNESGNKTVYSSFPQKTRPDIPPIELCITKEAR